MIQVFFPNESLSDFDYQYHSMPPQPGRYAQKSLAVLIATKITVVPLELSRKLKRPPRNMLD